MALQRPLKEGSVRTYQEKVGLGFTDILASEADGDSDTIYAAWNGTLGGDLTGTLPNPTLAAGAVTSAKLATDIVVVARPVQTLSGDVTLTNTFVTILSVTIPSTYRGGSVLCLVDVQGTLNFANTSSTRAGLVLKMDGSALRSPVMEGTANAAIVGGWVPIAMSCNFVTAVSAGQHTFSVEAAQILGTCTWVFKSGGAMVVAYA
jgi:hypothetical protein